MIESWPESHYSDRGAIELFRASMQSDYSDVRFAVIGSNIRVLGTVPTYAFKTRIDLEALSHGLAIENRVRVVPGRKWPAAEGFQLAG
jgi:hypothetical protein